MRKKKRSDESGFNVWRSYSDMMAGVLLLFVLITLLNLMNIAPTITCVSGLICQILYTMVFAEGSRGARLLIGGIPAFWQLFRTV